MAGGAGHIYDMIGRLRNNANILNGRGYFKTKQELLKISGKTVFEFKKATPEQIKAIKQKLRLQQKSRLRKFTLSLLFSSIVATGLIALLIYWFI